MKRESQPAASFVCSSVCCLGLSDEVSNVLISVFLLKPRSQCLGGRKDGDREPKATLPAVDVDGGGGWGIPTEQLGDDLFDEELVTRGDRC
jgi:hypothetical protein